MRETRERNKKKKWHRERDKKTETEIERHVQRATELETPPEHTASNEESNSD